MKRWMVHAYLTLDPARVHHVLTHELPELRAFARYVEQFIARSP